MSRDEIESSYKISRRIEGEERALDVAMMVFTSTQQEVRTPCAPLSAPELAPSSELFRAFQSKYSASTPTCVRLGHRAAWVPAVVTHNDTRFAGQHHEHGRLPVDIQESVVSGPARLINSSIHCVTLKLVRYPKAQLQVCSTSW